MNYRMDAVCGLYCGACKVLLADRNGTTADLAKERGVEPEQADCHGCKSGTVAVFCRDCRFRACVVSRGIEYCFECDEFPCSALQNFIKKPLPHLSVIPENLERMRTVGIPAWLDEQQKRWSCPECGQPLYWYDTTCSSCGAPVVSGVAQKPQIEAKNV